MSARAWVRLGVMLGLVAAYAAFGWIAGLILLLLIVIHVALYALRLRRALAPTIRCSGCGLDVPTYGRWSCRVCGAETMGSAWSCSWCSARHSWVRCPHCGLSCGSPLG